METRAKKRLKQASALERVRGNGGLMLQIYSFLPAFDRIRLAGVDKEFRDDESNRGRVVGVYGSRNLSLDWAFVYAREYLELEGTPWSLLEECENPPSLCWKYKLECFPKIQELARDGVLAEYFDEEEGYDIELLKKDMGDDVSPGVLEQLDYVNFYREDDRHKFDLVERVIESFLPYPPYAVLYNIMTVLNIPHHQIFYGARRPPADATFDDEVQQARRYAVTTDQGESFQYLENLRPGYVFQYMDGNGVQCEKSWKTCTGCLEVKEHTKREYCENCGDAGDRCRDCTTEYMCGSCDESHCMCERDNQRPFFSMFQFLLAQAFPE